ncbi:MAG TPA: hypothetical protein VG348_15915 [Acidimicrobiia bacterium]|jgi:hypothetical protein|nr:hypothetical protein [Acidimicrobiia bacterium]
MTDMTTWPAKGWAGPQPWDIRALGITKDQVEQLGPGAPNTLSPVKVRHSFPILGVGSHGPIVGELARRLHALGYRTNIGTGANPYSVLDDSVLAAVENFRDEYNVLEDPAGFGGTGQKAVAKAAEYVGPWTWEALIRACDQLARAAA